MKKVFYYSMLVITVIGFLGFIYGVFGNGTSNTASTLGLMFISLAAGSMALMTEPKATVKQETYGLSMLILISIAVIVILFASSCSKQGYGCKGNQSWKQMTKRINNGY